ncbi:GNAT family N-acetyltransferase [Nonomuraea sp. LP-02]|uniref:GNAT family N-acetyltransferase n=1 Tax=Nonomuraea sp. LP-02 TaxID=3097960 RepID=UPI002E2FD8AE|nr:N-acetyltransferase family protein [Nonomuraea sp. LP-02]MED7931979.1 GNAT family N-acetyltransferase [Nonomuraea sp. LP-02]
MNDVRTLDGSGPVEVAIGDNEDLAGIVALLNNVSATSIASFDSRPITVDERRAWFERFSSTGPYRLLVARRDGQVVGYACSQRYRDHDAFRETVELSVAIDAGCRGLGVGTSLYRALFESIADEPIHVAVVGIAMPNDASVALHRKFGFTEVGTFHEYAAKNGQYISSLWMERLL